MRWETGAESETRIRHRLCGVPDPGWLGKESLAHGPADCVPPTTPKSPSPSHPVIHFHRIPETIEDMGGEGWGASDRILSPGVCGRWRWQPCHPHQTEISPQLFRRKFSNFNNKPNAEKEPPDSVSLPATIWGIDLHFTDERPRLRA